MEQDQLAGTAGAIAALLSAAAVTAPFVAVPESEVAVVWRYYGAGVVSPIAVGLLGLVGTIAFAAGVKERSDPSAVAGLMLAAGAFSLVVTFQWALAFDGLQSVAASDETRAFLEGHRWSVLGATALWAASAGWYARALGLVGGRRR